MGRPSRGFTAAIRRLTTTRPRADRGARRSKWLRRVVIPAVILALLYVAVSLYIVDTALDAEANPLDERPEDFALPYEDVEFSPRGWPRLTLRGWWIPAPDVRATVIRVHGIDSNRSSALGTVPALVEGGYSVLAFDLRGHGESDLAQMGAGLHERDDLLGAIDYLIAERGAEPGTIFLYGRSYGAAIVLMSGWGEPAVAGVYADSAFASLSELVVQEVARRTSAPSWLASVLRPGVVLMARLSKGLDIESVHPAEDAARYPYAIGLAHCDQDDRIPISNLDRIRAEVRHPPRLTVYEGCSHADAWDDYPRRYEAHLIGYFDERLAS